MIRLRRMTLRRADGLIYLTRWGIQAPRLGGVFLHRMDAPDPGIDLHDHPWTFLSIVLKGGYLERRAESREAPMRAELEDAIPEQCHRGDLITRRPGSCRVMRLDECHRVTELLKRRAWTLVIVGPIRRQWGFYLPTGYMHEDLYDSLVRAGRRDLWSDEEAQKRPW